MSNLRVPSSENISYRKTKKTVNNNNCSDNSASTSNDEFCETAISTPRARSTALRPQKKRKLLADSTKTNTDEIDSECDLEYHLLLSEMLQLSVLDTLMEKSTSSIESKLTALKEEYERLKANVGQYQELFTLCKELEKLQKLGKILQSHLDLVDKPMENNLESILNDAVNTLNVKNVNVGDSEKDIKLACDQLKAVLEAINIEPAQEFRIASENLNNFENDIDNFNKTQVEFSKNMHLLNMKTLTHCSQKHEE